MNNFCTDIDGKTHWISRSVAVAGFIFKEMENDNLAVLANKRGYGTPNSCGLWNVPCGYLDYSETGEEACMREIYEETGINLKNILDKTNLLRLESVDTNPALHNQAVVLRYVAYIPSNISKEKLTLSADFADKNEVDEVKWIEVDKVDDYEWAFDHREMIKSLITKNK